MSYALIDADAERMGYCSQDASDHEPRRHGNYYDRGVWTDGNDGASASPHDRSDIGRLNAPMWREAYPVTPRITRRARLSPR